MYHMNNIRVSRTSIVTRAFKQMPAFIPNSSITHVVNSEADGYTTRFSKT